MKSVMAVHSTFSLKGQLAQYYSELPAAKIESHLNWIFLSGFCISGKMEQKG